MNTTAIVLIAAFAGIVIGFFLAFFCLGGLIARHLGGFEAGVQQRLDHHEASVHTRLNGLEAKLSGGIEGVQDDLCRLLGRAASGSSSTSDLMAPPAAPYAGYGDSTAPTPPPVPGANSPTGGG